MTTWIFQGNPDEFDIDGYLASRPPQIVWLVTRYASEMSVGDRVYLWRNQGKQKAIAGIVAEGVIASTPELRVEDSYGTAFWKEKNARASAPQIRVALRPIKVATKREVIRRDWCEEDPILRNLPNLKMQAQTNYLVSDEQEARIDALWGRTGRDWTRNESVAGLMAYAATYGKPVSRLPGSPIARVAMTLGRAVSGVYAKAMNFRALDPRPEGTGMTGAGETDKSVWNEFFDDSTLTLRTDKLTHEYERIWGSFGADAPSPADASARALTIEDEAGRLEKLSIAELLAKYRAQEAPTTERPRTRLLNVRAYERSSLVIAIARLRASYRCEMTDCPHPQFQLTDGSPYTEVHHITPLADGGPDTLENVACLCPAHHREIHLGARAAELTDLLRTIRAAT